LPKSVFIKWARTLKKLNDSLKTGSKNAEEKARIIEGWLAEQVTVYGETFEVRPISDE
jgi:hypothetical protein